MPRPSRKPVKRKVEGQFVLITDEINLAAVSPKKKVKTTVINKRRKREAYSSADIQNAIKDYLTSKCKSLREAARKYGVPASTLNEKFNGATPLVCSLGPSPILDRIGKESGLRYSLEEVLYKHLLSLCKQGFPISRNGIVAAVQSLLAAENISNPFLNDEPGKTWFHAFLKRFPDLKEHMDSNKQNPWKECSEEKWQGMVKDVANQCGISEVLQCAPRIICCDAISFSVNISTGKIILNSEGVTYPSIDNYSMVMAASADGKILAPTMVFNYDEIPTSVLQSRPKGWTYATSITGGVTGVVMLEFAAALHKVLVQKGLLEKSGSNQKVFLFLKNHQAHMDMDFIQFCAHHGIIVFCLPLNSTSNPVQKAVTTHFENIWAIEQQQQSANVNALNIGTKLAEALKQIKCNPIKTSFETCGLFPVGRDTKETDEVLSMPNGHLKEILESDDDMGFSRQKCLNALSVIEELMPAEDLERFQTTFRQHKQWDGAERCQALFEIWSKLKMRLKLD